MPTMNVGLTPEIADFVEREVRSGCYASASEVVRDSLRSAARERELEAEELAVVKAAVQAGLDDAEAGRFSGKSVADIAQDVLRRHHGREG